MRYITAQRAREIASNWHGGQWSALYQFSSSGVFLAANVLRYLKETQENLEPEYDLHPATLTNKDVKELESLKNYFVKESSLLGYGTEWHKHPIYGYQIPFLSAGDMDKVEALRLSI